MSDPAFASLDDVANGAADCSTERAISVPHPGARDHAHLVLLTGPSAGETFPLVRTETLIGRDDKADLQLDDSSISRRHACIVHEPSGEFFLEDLGSTNGTYVDAEAVTRRPISSGDLIQLGPYICYRFSLTDEVEERLQRQLYESAVRDPVTGAYNRKHLDERLAAEAAHARRHGTKLALLMLDLDDLKGTNDRHGHLAGDAVLRHVARTTHAVIRVEDVFARFGGDEFAVLTRGNDVHQAGRLAERLRCEIAATSVDFGGSPISVSVSIGVADLDEVGPPAALGKLIERADSRLYRAKLLGRNQIAYTDS